MSHEVAAPGLFEQLQAWNHSCGRPRELVATVSGAVLRRRGPCGTLEGKVRLDGRIHFVGGKYGEHSVENRDPERVLAHWEGYCEASGAGIAKGARVSFYASGLERTTTVISDTSPTSKTCMVGGFRYRNGGLASPRRIAKSELRVVRAAVIKGVVP